MLPDLNGIITVFLIPAKNIAARMALRVPDG